MGITSKLRFGAVTAAGAAAVILGSSCAAVVGEPDQEVVVIGVDLELTGAGADLGEVFLQALELRVDQVNDQGLLGNRQLDLQVLDNRSDRPTAVANLETLAADPSVSVIVSGGCAECVVHAADAIEAHGVPTISLARASEVAEPVAERRHIFKLGPNAGDNAAVLARALADDGVTTIGMVATDDGYGQDGVREMETAARRVGIEVVVTETITASEDRLEAAAAQILAYQEEQDPPAGGFGAPADEPEAPGPAAVVVWAPSGLAGDFAVTLRAAGYEGPLYLDAAAADDVLLVGAAGAALAGATMVFTETLVIDDVIVTSPAKAARKTWVRDYTARFGRYHASSSFAADAVELVVQAINAYDGADQDRATLRTGLEVMQLEGFTGTIQMSPRQHSGLRPQALTTLVARGDRWRPAA